MSLRLRLSLLFLILLVSGMVAVMGRSVETARNELQRELAAVNFLTTQLLDLFQDAGEAGDFYDQLLRLEMAPSFDVEIVSDIRAYPEFNQSTGTPLLTPAWFVSLLDIDEDLLIRSLGEYEGDQVIIHNDPTDAINQIWRDTLFNTIIRMAGLGFFVLVIFVAVGHWLKPVNQILLALDEMVKGDFSRRVPRIKIFELDRISLRINQLVGVLGASREDNARLTRQTLTTQEQQRRYFAQELHDSLGQSVSAIKAMAVSIILAAPDNDQLVAESARRIAKISDDAYASVRDLMAWLRPAVLDELGLVQAVQTMVDDWNQHHEDTFCRLRIDGSFDDLGELQKINIYRIMQEALTNIAKHAEADMADMMLGGQEVLSLIISDNGKGFDQERVVMGMGLSGIRDRVNMLQGTFAVTTAPGKGTNFQIEIPRVAGYRRRASDKIPA